MDAFADKMLLKLPDFMASNNSKKSESQRPHPLKVARSFSSKVEPTSPATANRGQRASTIQNGVMADKTKSDNTIGPKKATRRTDVFEKSPDGEAGDGGSGKLPADFDQLPIELISLTDRLVVFYICNFH